MDTPSPVVLRQRVLTNSAAEFVERRADLEALLQVRSSSQNIRPLQDSVEFVTEMDRFAYKGEVFDHERCYEQSRKSIAQFRQTLRRFVDTLKRRKVDSQLDISIENPDAFTINDILGIINKLGEGQGDDSKTGSCKSFIRRCYRRVEDNRDVIEAILSMLPSDIYGSVISGGFSLIMAAVEDHAEQREQIHSFLSEIPEKLETIQRLSDIHHASPQLHLRVDAVMVAIFVALTSIIDQLTSSWKTRLAEKTERFKRGISSLIHSKSNRRKQKADGGIAGEGGDNTDHEQNTSVPDALAELRSRIQEFQTEVDMCAQERLGRIELGISDVKRALALQKEQYERTMELFAAAQVADETVQAVGPQVLAIQDALYRLCTSNPNFNTKTGEVDIEEVLLRKGEKETVSVHSRQKSNTKIANRWCKRLEGICYDPEVDMKDCLEHIEQLEPDEKNIAQFILNSDQFKAWLEERQSKTIEINLQTPPSSLCNPLSFDSALFVATVQSANQFPVLAFFAMHRNNESPSESRSGPTALVKSLNGQLLQFIAAHRPSVDISSLGKEFLSQARSSLKDGLRLLSALILSLPKDDMVFFVADSLSRLSGHERDADKVFKKLHRIIQKREDLVIKLMMTDTLAGSYAKSMADESFYVRDLVAGFGAIDIEESQDELSRQVKRSRGGKRADMPTEHPRGSPNREDDDDSD